MKTLNQELERNKRMENQLNGRTKNGAPSGSAQKLYNDMRGALPKNMLPGNVGDINSVVWPFWFSFNAAELPPNSGSNSFVTITQEAAFIFMAISKVVFLKTGAMAPFQYTAINALDTDESFANAPDLRFTLQDAQSTRVFLNVPMSLDEIGCAEFPTVLPTPQMLLPNSTLQCIYQNSNALNTYVPFVTLFGYRVRLENAAAILSTITG